MLSCSKVAYANGRDALVALRAISRAYARAAFAALRVPTSASRADAGIPHLRGASIPSLDEGAGDALIAAEADVRRVARG
jgi:hypothetical protein